MSNDADWLYRYAAAWSSHDPAQVAAFMAPDVVYEDVAAGVVVEGADGVETFAAEAAKIVPDLTFETLNAYSAVGSYTWEWRMTGAFAQSRFDIRGVSVGSIDANGAIVSNRDFYNLPE